MLIWKLEVSKWSYARKENWLEVSAADEPFDYLDDDRNENYEIYFSNFESMSEYIDKITAGHRQYWAGVREGTDSDVEELEYHNGIKWDSEIHLTTKKVRIHESLVGAIKSM